MSLDPYLITRVLLFASIVAYLVFSFFESKRIKDEREELIQLKAYELVHRTTSVTVAGLVIAHALWPQMSALFVIIAIIIATMYTEVAGKIYFRQKL